MKLIKQLKQHIGSPSLMFLMFHLIAPHLHAQAIDIVGTCSQLVCFPTPLTQASFADGQTILTQPGNYILCEDVVGNLSIADSSISVDLNNRRLDGIVTISGSDVVLENGFIYGAPQYYGAPLRTPAPTAVVTIEGFLLRSHNPVENVYLKNLVITSIDMTGQDSNNNGLSSLDGILNHGINTFILDSTIQTGNGGNGGNAFPHNPAGRGGRPGTAVITDGPFIQLRRTLVKTGNGGNGGNTSFGMFPDAADGAPSGIGIKIHGDSSFVVECEVLTGAGGNGGQSGCGNGGNGGGSADGIFCIAKSDAQIKDCTSRTGNAGNGGIGIAAMNNVGGNGGDSGHALHTQGTQVINNVASTGNAGHGANGGKGGNGGDVGYALFIDNACNTQARYLVVEYTGQGGNGGNSLTAPNAGGNGGNGGDAVHITQDARHSEVRFSTLSNTGEGGTGGNGAGIGAQGKLGNPGRAVTDLNEDLCSLDPQCTLSLAPSAIFENFASGIADNDIRYLINGKDTESGKASNKSCNYLDNVFVDCNVNEVFDICQAITDLRNTITACCPCDFFITQLPNGQPNNHPITNPITEPGIYCLAEDVTGTILIQAHDVTINFNGHILTATTIGIDSTAFNNIRIQGGTIQRASRFGIALLGNINVTIADMIFTNNTSGAALVLQEVQNFVINNCQWNQNGTSGEIALTSSRNGVISNCICQNSQNANTPSIINVGNCAQLSFENIIITNNTMAQQLTAIRCLLTRESTFNNIRITYNNTKIAFTGIYMTDCDDNIMSNCTINKNNTTVVAHNNGFFTGIEITTRDFGDFGVSRNNTITDCQIHDNAATSGPTIGNDLSFYGISLASTFTGNNINAHACENTTIQRCSIHNNQLTHATGYNYFVGINAASVTKGSRAIVHEYACNNCTFEECSINNNICTIAGNGILFFVGLNLASVINNGYVHDHCGENCTVSNCTINNNALRSDESTFVVEGISIASVIAGTHNSIGSYSGSNCVINNCAINSNSAQAPSTYFKGIVLAGTINRGTIQNDVAKNCAISNCSILNNASIGYLGYFSGIDIASTNNIGTIARNSGSRCIISESTISNNSLIQGILAAFVGINLGGAIDEGQISDNVASESMLSNCIIDNNICSISPTGSYAYFLGINVGGIFGVSFQFEACNNLMLENIQITRNIFISPNNADFFNAIFMNGVGGSSGLGGCNNIIARSCIIENNSAQAQSAFAGFRMDGRSFQNLGGCNNILLSQCSVQQNIGTNGSNAYVMLATNTDEQQSGQNIRFEQCSAQDNAATPSALDGFSLHAATNAILQQCVSIANTGTGFKLSDVTNSTLLECKAFDNSNDGFAYAGTTNNVTTINCQALGNGDDGFDFEVSTTQCLINRNVAQNNTIGFNNQQDDEFKHQFFNNSAQANTGNNFINVPLVASLMTATNPFSNIES